MGALVITSTRIGDALAEHKVVSRMSGRLLSATQAMGVLDAALVLWWVMREGGGQVGLVLALAVGVTALMVWYRSSTVVEESLLVMDDFGVQTRTVWGTGHTRSQFIDRQKIRAVVINEGITRWQCICYVAFIVDGEDRLVVGFPHLRPPLAFLKAVYKSVNAGPLAAVAQEEARERENSSAAPARRAGAALPSALASASVAAAVDVREHASIGPVDRG